MRKVADPTKRKFGKRIKELRLEKGTPTQAALADISGIDRTYIGGIERGQRNPSLRTIAKIACALDVPIRELFNFK